MILGGLTLKQKRHGFALVFFLVAPFLFCAIVEADNIDATSHFAYSENMGWITLKPSQGPGVTVCDNSLAGYAYGVNIGWIKFDPEYGGVMNDGLGNLSGYAWAENSGWINFAPTSGGVSINTTTGMFYGYAWGENVGWINFAPANGGVATSWRPHRQKSVRNCSKTTTANETSTTSTSTTSNTATTSTSPALTGTAILSWDLGTEADLGGYKVFVGTQSGNYNYPGSPFTVGLVTSFTLNNLPAGQTYFFAISAYNTSGNHSALSSEVSKSVY